MAKRYTELAIHNIEWAYNLYHQGIYEEEIALAEFILKQYGIKI